MARRFDAGQYRKPEILPNGFLKADAILTRTGVFAYRLGNGKVRRELRLPEEVFHPDALKSFEMLPVTDEHPPVPVDAANVKKFQAGQIGDGVAQDGKFVVAPMLVTDAKLVADMQAGKKTEVSCGYDCDLEMKPGRHDQYGEYDAVQRNIRGNHVAVVPRGRAGPEVRVRMDAEDGIEEPGEKTPVQPIPEPQRSARMKIRIDGIDYDPEQVPQVLERRDAAQRAAAEAQASKLKAAEDALAKARADAETAATAAKAELDKATARADGLKADLDKAAKARADAEDPKRIAELVAARVAIETRARAVLGADFKLDGLDEKAIRAEMLKKLEPGVKLDGKSDDYVAGRLDHALERADRENEGLAKLRRDANPIVKPGEHQDSEAMRAEAIRKLDEAWKPKKAS